MGRENRQAYRDFQYEEIAQWWGGLLAVSAAAAAAWYTWASLHNPLVTLLATIVALPLGYCIGHKLSVFLSAVLALVVVTVAVFVFINHQTAQKTEKEAAFDPKSLPTTLLWLKGKGQKVTESDQKNNEVLAREALDQLNRELAQVEGTQIQWEAQVQSVSPDAVILQVTTEPMTVKLALTAGKEFPAQADSTDLRALPITPEQSRQLVSGQTVTFTGRLLVCRAERSGASLVYTLRVVEARIVESKQASKGEELAAWARNNLGPRTAP